MVVMSFVVLLVAVLRSQFPMSCFEVGVLILAAWATLQLFQVTQMMLKIEISIRRIMSCADHGDFAAPIQLATW